MLQPADLLQPGRFIIGCNYWASHAGTRMWADWRPEVVERDFRLLSEAGLQLLRVFPLWPEFQPIHMLYGGGGHEVEVRFGEEPLSDTPAGRAGMSQQALDHFAEFCDLAAKYDLSFDVGLLTGWMSGRLHVPPALEGRNVLTDPFALRWELRFVRHFVQTLKEHPAIVAWDLGNECNCMGAANRDQAYTWTAAIVNAIRAVDPVHPVVSGLHSLSPTGNWTARDQGELTDLLTTHPYPVFTPHCNQDPVNTIRTILHSTAESRFYADLGGKPCLCQEIGTLGPCIASEAIAADFIRSCLFSLWANDCHGLVWWCANEQTELAHAPYDWHAVERELGLLRVDGSAKPVLHELTKFRTLLKDLGLEALPPARQEAVCILTPDQDQWGVAYSAYVLAKQAGLNLEFQWGHEPLREAALYLLPCLSGHAMLPRRRLLELQAKVEAGATLYMSLDSGLPSNFEPFTGLEPQTREKRAGDGEIVFFGTDDLTTLPCGGTFRLNVRPTRAQVLGAEEDNPVFTVAALGQGKVYFLGMPLELLLTQRPGAFSPEAPEYWRVYRRLAADLKRDRTVTTEGGLLGLTEHELDANRRLVIGVNYSPEPLAQTCELAPGWALGEVRHGQVSAAGVLHVAANDAVVFTVKRGG